jgi:hypothetical protein
MNEMASVLSLLSRPLPAVVLRCNANGAKWFGKYEAGGVSLTKSLGGPWDTEAEGCAALVAAGWVRRAHKPGLAGPHFDRH